MPSIVVNGTIHLPPDMNWVDEFGWIPRGTTDAVSLTGKLMQQNHANRNGGRPITLQSAPDAATVTRAQLEALIALAKLPPHTFELSMADGRTYAVRFDTVDNAPIEAEAVQPGKRPEVGDLFVTTIRFKEMPV